MKRKLIILQEIIISIIKFKKNDETTVMAVKYCESGREEVIKNDKKKIKNDNNDNNSPKISHKMKEKNVIGKNLHYQGILMPLIIIICPNLKTI